MAQWTRRKFLGDGVKAAAAGAVIAGGSCAEDGPDGEEGPGRGCVPLDGTWSFRTDPQNEGERLGWQKPRPSGEGWEEVRVPETWQVRAPTVDYMGTAWYRREFEVPPAWKGAIARLEFEAVFHTARVWVNGRPAGEHVEKGYTAFALDITPLLEYGKRNTVAVAVTNAFSPSMLPRSNSYDWTPDGGITRPVRLLLTPQVFIESIAVDAWPDLGKGTASLEIKAAVRNASEKDAGLRLGFRVIEEATGLVVLENPAALETRLAAGTTLEQPLPAATLAAAKLWHFDQPNRYVLEVEVSTKKGTVHALSTTFGVRSIEVRGAEFLLNGEPVRLHGVERMAGSHPGYGMAEPETWIVHDHDDLKQLNCVFTRVHWQQDRRVLDYCDRHGILIQVEVPTWGGDTFKGMPERPSDEIMTNGLDQLREMIGRDRNHPCVFSWGLCNEVDGQNPPAKTFVREMLREAKHLDPRRLCSYASNSLGTTPEADVAGEMDFIEWNEYYETWYGGDVEAMRKNLEAIHRAFPGKPVVISEYGYCACTEDRPENDARRAEILRNHNRVFRDHPWVAGLIFFCYNDYRTHIGDKGLGVLKQRVHGVVDVFGARKPSYEVLRRESGPVEKMEARAAAGRRSVIVRTRKDIPAYTLRGYRLSWTVYGDGAIPVERGEAPLPVLKPGDATEVSVELRTPKPRRVVLEVVRPTGFSAATLVLTE
jgi:beta-galactosidase